MEYKMNISLIILIVVLVIIIIFFAGVRIVRPTNRGLVETLGKYTKYAEPGFHWIIPGIQNLYMVNITEQMFSAEQIGRAHV